MPNNFRPTTISIIQTLLNNNNNNNKKELFSVQSLQTTIFEWSDQCRDVHLFWCWPPVPDSRGNTIIALQQSQNRPELQGTWNRINKSPMKTELNTQSLLLHVCGCFPYLLIGRAHRPLTHNSTGLRSGSGGREASLRYNKEIYTYVPHALTCSSILLTFRRKRWRKFSPLSQVYAERSCKPSFSTARNKPWSKQTGETKEESVRPDSSEAPVALNPRTGVSKWLSSKILCLRLDCLYMKVAWGFHQSRSASIENRVKRELEDALSLSTLFSSVALFPKQSIGCNIISSKLSAQCLSRYAFKSNSPKQKTENKRHKTQSQYFDLTYL